MRIFFVLVAALMIGCSAKSATTKPAPAPTAAAKPAAEKEPTTSLYDRLGGEKAIRAVVDDFVSRTAGDAKVNFNRQGVATTRPWDASPANVDLLKTRMVQFLCVASGGPQKYEGRDLRAAHKGMAITDAEFDAIAANLKASLDQLKVPAREQKELIEIVGSTRGVIVEPAKK